MAATSQAPSLQYEQTLMYGKYKEDLAATAKREAERLKFLREQQQQQQQQQQEDGGDDPKGPPPPYDEASNAKDGEKSEAAPAAGNTGNTGEQEEEFRGKKDQFTAWDCWYGCLATLRHCRMFFFRYVGEDWFFLAMLGIIMASVSFVIDSCIEFCHEAHDWLYEVLAHKSPTLQYVVWILFTVIFVLFSTGFTHIVSPNAIGSGIPEMKTIFRGVILNEFLTFKTFVAKSVGIITALGSGLPLGKEGPFVHISSIVASLLGKCMSKKGVYENESKQSEMMGAAVAVGVGCSFAAPIGGVLFAIEVTSTLFATANYWRGFFAAVISATFFRMMDVWAGHQLTVTALLRTNYRLHLPFFPTEFLAYLFVGTLCGLGGAFFVYSHRRWVLFMRGNKSLNKFLQKNRFIYPLMVAIIIGGLSCPLGPGRYFAGGLTQGAAVKQLFSNFTWTGAGSDPDVKEATILENWRLRPGDSTSVFISLGLFIFMQFWMSIVAITLPVPAGAFIPVFTLGAAIGRFVGEALATWFPDGIHGDHPIPIIPGSYAVVGAAAFAGAATHTISTTVIVSELTGQINHILPLAFAVLTANFVAKALDLNIFDSIIRIKKLPYLPDISTSDHTAFNIFVDDFMVKDVKYMSYTDSQYSEIKQLLDKTKLRSCPLVDSHQNMVLLGSLQRAELQLLLDRQIGRERKMREPQQQLEKVSIESRLSSRRNSSVIETMPNLAGLNQVKEQLKAIAHISQSWAPGESLGLPMSAPPTFRGEPHWSEDGTPKEPRKSILKRTTSESKSVVSSEAEGTLQEKNTAIGDDDDVFLPAITVETPQSKKKSPTTTASTTNPLSGVFAPPTPTATSEADVRKESRTAGIRGSISNVAKTIKAPFVKTGSSGAPGRRVIDLPPEEQEAWEDVQLRKIVNFSGCIIDPAPFQLVAHTSLHKVHSLFSLLSLKQAYVTNIGRLVGVVGLVELRKIIEGTSAGTAKPKPFIGVPEGDDIEMRGASDDDSYYDDDEDEDSDAGSFMDLGPSDFEYGSDRLLDADQKIRAEDHPLHGAGYKPRGDAGMAGVDAVALGASLGALSFSAPSGGQPAVSDESRDAGASTSKAAAATMSASQQTEPKMPGSRFRKFIVTEASDSNGFGAVSSVGAGTPASRQRKSDDADVKSSVV